MFVILLARMMPDVLAGVKNIIVDTRRSPLYNRRMEKVKVALFLDAAVARELKVQAAQCGARGLSAYITRLIAPPRKLKKKNAPMASGGVHGGAT